jgi:predicted ATP-grasp superfamily ATP-dependent carboligase
MAAPAVVVSGSEVSLGVVRDLGRERVPVLAMCADQHNPAFRSRYCIARSCADPHYEEMRLIADLEAAAVTLPQRPVLLPCDDDSVLSVSRHKARLERSFFVPVLGWEGMQVLADKEQQIGLARRAGIELPITASLHGPDDLAAAAEAVPFPAVLKSRAPMGLFRRAGFKVVVVEGRKQLERAYDRFASCGPFLLQEIIPGGDEQISIAGGYHVARSRCLALFTGRKLRQHPRGFGVARLCETRWDPEIADLTGRLLAEVGYQGISDVEFKRDPRDGRPKFMEINPRAGFLTSLPTAAGVNLSYIAYRDAVGRPCPTCRQRDGVRWSNLLADGPDSLKEFRRRDLDLREWLAPLLGVRADAYLSLHDPRPGLGELSYLAARQVRKRTRGLVRAREDDVAGGRRTVCEDGPVVGRDRSGSSPRGGRLSPGLGRIRAVEPTSTQARDDVGQDLAATGPSEPLADCVTLPAQALPQQQERLAER